MTRNIFKIAQNKYFVGFKKEKENKSTMIVKINTHT